MGALKELAEGSVHHAGMECRLAQLRASLDKATLKDLDELMAGNVPCTAISRALAKLGHNITSGVLQFHRRGECVSCGRAR